MNESTNFKPDYEDIQNANRIAGIELTKLTNKKVKFMRGPYQQEKAKVKAVKVKGNIIQFNIEAKEKKENYKKNMDLSFPNDFIFIVEPIEFQIKKDELFTNNEITLNNMFPSLSVEKIQKGFDKNKLYAIGQTKNNIYYGLKDNINDITSTYFIPKKFVIDVEKLKTLPTDLYEEKDEIYNEIMEGFEKRKEENYKVLMNEFKSSSSIDMS